MTSLLIELLITSFIGSIIYIEILIINKLFLRYYCRKSIYFFLKIGAVIYALPIHLLVKVLIDPLLEKLNLFIDREDFSLMRFIKGELFLFSSDNILIFQFIFYCWLSVFLILFIYDIIKALRFKKSLKTTRILLDNDMLNKIISDLKDELNIRKNIPVYFVPKTDSAFIVGIVHPAIYLSKKYNSKDLKLILKHELIHYKNKDILFKSLSSYIRILHWFNPVIYLYTKFLYQYTEYTCDEILTDSFDSNERFYYSELILNESSKNNTSGLTTAFSKSSEKRLQRRLLYIMKPKKKLKLGMVSFLTAAIIASCPIITYASTNTNLFETIRKASSNIETHSVTLNNNEFIKIVENNKEGILIPFSAVVTRGTNEIAFSIPTGYVAYTEDIDLKSGNDVLVYIYSDSSTDNFDAGIRKGLKFRYTQSVNGVINHIFKITEDGSYCVYIENNSDRDINIEGLIHIK